MAIVRRDSASADELFAIARAIAATGFGVVEFPLTNSRALAAMELVASSDLPVLVGAGTVLTPADVDAAASAGAEFIVSPGLNTDVVSAAHRAGLGCLPGALSPTEIAVAIAMEVAGVKLFPAGPLGFGYLSAILAPFPGATIVPTGGVSIDDVSAWLDAGATAVGLGGDLIADGSPEAMAQRARRLRATISRREEAR